MWLYVAISFFLIKTFRMRYLQEQQHLSKLLDRPLGMFQLVLFEQKTLCEVKDKVCSRNRILSIWLLWVLLKLKLFLQG